MVNKKSKKRDLILILSVLIIVIILGYAIYYVLTFTDLIIFHGWGLSNLGNVCIANQGYACNNPIYNHQTGSILLSVGQNTGTGWISANFVFVPQGIKTKNGIPLLSFNSYPANTSYSTNGLVSGQTVNIRLQVNGVVAPVSVGTVATGSIWVEYTTSIDQTPHYLQIATINIKAS